MTTNVEILPKVDRILDDQINQIWEYVREHRDNLDSERGCKMIRVACERAVEQVNQLLAEATARLEVASSRKAELKSELKESQKQAAETQAKLVAAESRVSELQASLEAAEKAKAAQQQFLEEWKAKRKKAAGEDPTSSEPEPLTAKA